MEKLVSVIVPVYNVEDYIENCLASISAQSYRYLDIIIVNDGATDHSLSICERFVQADERMRLITQSNQGLSAARNTGLDHARGSYICFVDSDDFVHPDYVHTLLELLIAYDADIVQCAYTRFGTASDIRVDDAAMPEITVYDRDIFLESLYNKQFYPANIISWNKLYKKELWTSVRFPSGRLHEDEFTTPETMLKADKIVLTTQPLYYYLQREGSITSSGKYARRYADMIDCLSIRKERFRQYGNKQLESQTELRLYYFIYDFMRVERNHPVYTALLKQSLKGIWQHQQGGLAFKMRCLLLAIWPSLFYALYGKKAD